MAASIDFYFDFISPFSYLAWQQLPALAKRYCHDVRCRVIDLAAAKLLAGNTGPTSRDQPLKRRYNQKDKERWARRLGVAINNPTSYGPDRLNKGFFFAEDRGAAHRYVTAGFSAVWGEGGDMAGEPILRAVARSCDFPVDDFLAFTLSPGADERYRDATHAAHQRGVFGVPTMMIGDEMWWGNDRLDFFEEYLRAHATVSV